MTIDTSPGSPDGPPLLPEEPKEMTVAGRIGAVLGAAACLAVIVLILLACVWGIAWLVENWPGK